MLAVNRTRVIKTTVVLIIAMIISVAVGQFLPSGIDWHESFRPASIALLAGQSPYSVETFYAAPWSLIPLLPLALLPEDFGRGLLFTVSILSFAVLARRLDAKPLAFAVFLLSPPVLHGLLNANIDWLAMLGFILPPQVGLFFVVIKPQVGLGLVVYWLVEAWRVGKFKRVVQVFAPVTLAGAVSILILGFWPFRFQNIIDYSSDFNASFWPASLPIGLTLIAASLHKEEPRFAVASSPCFSPHVVFHSYAGVLAALLPQTIETVTAVIGLWILVNIRAFTGG